MMWKSPFLHLFHGTAWQIGCWVQEEESGQERLHGFWLEDLE